MDAPARIGNRDLWTEAETAKLIELWPQRMTQVQIARWLGKSPDATRNKGKRLGLPVRPSIPASQPVRKITWTPALKAQLRAAWARGDTSKAIGEALGLSKNAVIGAVHRIGLPARQSPIKRAPTYEPYSCQWIERGGVGFTDADKCGGPIVPNKHTAPYCLAHYRRAYQVIRTERAA